MSSSRRTALLGLMASSLLVASNRDSQDQQRPLPVPPNPDQDIKLPNGKSQKNEMAKQAHEQALKDADDLVTAAQQLRDELQKSGNYVVSMSSVKKTEEIEKLARRIRGRLKQ